MGRIRYLATFTALMTWFLLFVGAMVTSTGSGLSVPDWPLSYGQFFPKMVGGVFYEHGHRMVAGLVALLMIALAAALVAKESRPWVKKLALFSLGLVLFQAVLGGLTVLLRLPPAVSVSHAIIGQSFFCATVVMALAISNWWPRLMAVGAAQLRDSKLSTAVFLLTAIAILQLFFGASMRHLGAGLAIPDFPLVFGGIVPPRFDLGTTFHYLHRVGAFSIVGLVVFIAARIFGKHSQQKTLTVIAWVLVGVVSVQFMLGAFTIWMKRPVSLTTSHLAVGALCLAASVVLSIHVYALCKGPKKNG